jgi:hypothetical protein
MKTKKSKIIEAYKKNLPKFEELIELSRELNVLTNERDILIAKVAKLYNIILKNISSKRKPLAFSSGMYLGPAGITKKSSIYASNIVLFKKEDFLKELIKLSKYNLKQELQNVLSKEKIKIIIDFVKKAELLRIIEPFSLHIEKKIFRFFLSSNTDKPLKEVLVTKLAIIGRRLMINLNDDDESHSFSFEFFSSENAILIEQLYPETKKLLKSDKKQKVKEIMNISRFIAFIKDKFGNTLAVEELQNENN